MRFDPLSYLLGEMHNATSSLRYEDVAGQEVFIVGSGPSIDRTNLALIRDANVVLLNSAYQLASRFGKNNQFYWFCQDTRALLQLGPNVPPSIKKIITVHRFNRMWKVRSFLAKKDIFLQPRLAFRRTASQSASPLYQRISPRPYFKTGAPFLHNPNSPRIDLLPSTVMLTAISIFGGLGAQRICCLGFDLTPTSTLEARVSVSVQQPYKTGALPAERIEWFLYGLQQEMATHNQDLVNGSPGTYEKILQKDERFSLD
jgi:hypothetical protein